MHWKPWVLALCMVPGMLCIAPRTSEAQAPASAPILVIPFDNPGHEARLTWLREGAAILLSETLASAGEPVIDRDDRLQAFDRLQFPVNAALSRASTVKIGQAVTASMVVSGSVTMQADLLTVRAQSIRLDSGRLMPEVESSGPLADLFLVFGRLAQQIRGVSAPPPQVTDRLPPSPQVFELYVKGLIAETPATALAFLQQTLKAAPRFDRARLAIWDLQTEASEHQKAFDAVAGIKPDSPFARDARFRGALSLMSLRRLDDALQTLRAMLAEQPAASVANALGVAELRRGASPQAGRATYYFSEATKLDPSDGDLFFNLGYAYWSDKDAKAAVYWLREAVRRDPGDGDAHFILGVALQQTGASSEATRERELAAQLSSKYAGWQSKAAGGDPVPRGLERLHEQLNPVRSRVDDVIALAGQRDQEQLAVFHLDAGRRAFEREADREAIGELRRALYLSPYLSEAHLLLGRLYLRGGRPGDAVEALKISLWSAETVAAHVWLAQAFLQVQDQASARTEIERALALDPKSADALAIKAKLGGGPW